ncbi:oligopeptide/dipeptide ABC transporter ATP-binding protein [Nioella ostreopsis]|uniref:oligopeptide/dipeptide ABC transporter ATP-binding protein n=1 Tax=Nioella ostreopsis TaxID=2448479 RepID=UPI0013E01E88|nr:oligopeptide/dipeptide ABC transporter ATP-binding protein [Nioella ostreopsis]
MVDEEIQGAIYNKLIQYTPGRDWGWQLDAATMIEQVDDTHINFVLRDDIGFTNGFGAMSAEDVKFSFERIIDDALESTNRPDWGPLSHVEVTGERTGTIVLNNAFQPLWSITLPYIAGNIVSKNAFGSVGGLKEAEFITAERALGASTLRIMGVHLLPNVLGTLAVLAAMDIPTVVGLEAGLSLLGMGVRPPTPSWGSLLIADEPTTALDATLEVQIIKRLRELQDEIGCSILFISHHLGVIAELCDEVVVMYAGEVVEAGSVRDVFHNPAHPYTRALLECDPGHIKEKTRNLPTIPGNIPDLVSFPRGCIFADRCPQRHDACTEHPVLSEASAGHRAACHLIKAGAPA